MAEKNWRSYEDVAEHLLNEFALHFGLGRFEGKQILAGKSGTTWEIDAKGCAADGSHFVVVECKRHIGTGISQGITASLAWNIQDMGASGGILVSPLGLQEGAKKVAKSGKIVEVILNQDSTKLDYFLQFLNHVCLGVSETVGVKISETLTITSKDEDGRVVETKSVQ